MSLGPGEVLSVVIEIVKILDDLRKQRSENKVECQLLEDLIVQSNSHRDLLDDLEAKLKGGRLHDISALLEEIRREYGLLERYLKEMRPKLSHPLKGALRAPGFKDQLQKMKIRLRTTVGISLVKVQVVLSCDAQDSLEALVKGVQVLLMGQHEQLEGGDRQSEALDRVLRGQEDVLHIVVGLAKQVAAVSGKPEETQKDEVERLRREYDRRTAEVDSFTLDPDRLTVDHTATLGQGSHGVVRAGTLVYCGKPVKVAVKSIDVCSIGRSAESNLERELKRIKGANLACGSAYVCRFFGLCKKDGVSYLVMQRYNTSLHKVLLDRGRLSLQEACDIGRRVAVGLRELHGAKFLHLDVKPGNILLDDADNAVLADFSCATHLSGTTYQATTRGTSVGTWQYMSPEAAFPDEYGQLQQPADVWSFAATLLHMLTGELPWPKEASMSRVYGCLLRKQRGIGLKVPTGLPNGLSSLLEDCFSFEQRSRPSLDRIIGVLTAVLRERKAPEVSAAAVPGAHPTATHSPSEKGDVPDVQYGNLESVSVGRRAPEPESLSPKTPRQDPVPEVSSKARGPQFFRNVDVELYRACHNSRQKYTRKEAIKAPPGLEELQKFVEQEILVAAEALYFLTSRWQEQERSRSSGQWRLEYKLTKFKSKAVQLSCQEVWSPDSCAELPPFKRKAEISARLRQVVRSCQADLTEVMVAPVCELEATLLKLDGDLQEYQKEAEVWAEKYEQGELNRPLKRLVGQFCFGLFPAPYDKPDGDVPEHIIDQGLSGFDGSWRPFRGLDSARRRRR